MLTDDQVDVIEFLAAPSAHGTATVDRIDTHSAIVFLAGERAYKLKRAVRFDYLDFSTVERRRAMCDAEVRLNRRTAPGIYRGVVPITREPGGTLVLGGSGAPIDWVVEMNRFSQEALFDRLAAAGRLDLELMPPLAAAIARDYLAMAEALLHPQGPCLVAVGGFSGTGKSMLAHGLAVRGWGAGRRCDSQRSLNSAAMMRRMQMPPSSGYSIRTALGSSRGTAWKRLDHPALWQTRH